MSDLGNKEIFAKNLKYYMKYHDKDRAKIADDLNIPYTTFNDWYNAITYPRIDKIEMIANYFNIQKSDLIENKYKENNAELDEYDLLFSKFKDLEQNDKELIKNIIETRKKQIDEQLGESE